MTSRIADVACIYVCFYMRFSPYVIHVYYRFTGELRIERFFSN